MKTWRIIANEDLKEIPISTLDAESVLEDWIAKKSAILGLELLIIGRQVTTEFGGRIDLLAINRQGDITVIELKRGKTPRDVVAQVLDYASWIKRLTYKDLNSICQDHLKKDLPSAFSYFFNDSIPENVNVNHRMLIVASEFDDSSQRIVEYLTDEYQVNINVIFFSVFKDQDGEILGRAWLMDPEDVQYRAESRKQAPWSGYWFVNTGDGAHRTWDDNVKYGFIGAGQGSKYSGSLKKLKNGDSIFAYVKGVGYVGFGVVIEPAKMLRDFYPAGKDKALTDLPLEAKKACDNPENPEDSEWAVKVDWKKTFDKNNAKTFRGVFANQNIVCKLRDTKTLDYLKTQFEIEN